MKKLFIRIYYHIEEYGEWWEAIPFDVREYTEGINEDKTCFIQKVMAYNEEYLKIKVLFGDSIETLYLPISRCSIRQVEIQIKE